MQEKLLCALWFESDLLVLHNHSLGVLSLGCGNLAIILT